MDGAWKRGLTEEEVRRLAADIDRSGFGTIENYISAEELAGVRALAETKVREAGGQYVALQGPAAVDATVLAQIGQSPGFAAVGRRLVELGSGRSGAATDSLQVLRCLQGSVGQSNSNRFHYDSYVLTVIIAIAVPDAGQRGDLVLFRNPRAIRRFYFANTFDKVLADNPLSQWLFRAAARNNRPNVVRVAIRPGTAYFIWGYRTLHANEPCDADKLRVTAVFHWGDPHRDSFMRRLIRAARRSAGY